MNVIKEVRIEGSHGGSIKLEKGDQLRLTNIEGSQVADLWAFSMPDAKNFLSTEHTRSCVEKLVPQVGDSLYSDKRHPMLTIVEDNSPGHHDMLMSACDKRRYEMLGHEGYHRSCADNLREVMAELGLQYDELPSPFNTFQRVEIAPDNSLAIVSPTAKAGDNILFLAEMDLTVVVSACPMDIAMTNGPDGKTRPILLERIQG